MGAVDAEFVLSSELITAIHTIVNMQSKCDAVWYKELLVPAASDAAKPLAHAAEGTLDKWYGDDNTGAAAEVAAVVAFSASLMVLELASGESSLRSSGRFNLAAGEENDAPPRSGCRTTKYTTGLTHDKTRGFAPDVTTGNLRALKSPAVQTDDEKLVQVTNNGS